MTDVNKKRIAHNKKWDLGSCKANALQYKSRKDWRKLGKGYHTAHKNGWLDECCQHMDILWNKKWTLEACKTDALKYTNRGEWQKKSKKAYKAAYKNSWLKECCRHMKNLKTNWTYELCKKEALKYKTKIEWKTNSHNSYNKAIRNGWATVCSAHMVKPLKKPKWTLNDCKLDALKYKTKIEWKKNSPIYQAALKNSWIKECTKHMHVLTERGKWTLKACKIDALKYKTKTEWYKNSPAYKAAFKNEWLEECCQHMDKISSNSIPEKELKNKLQDLIPNLTIINNKFFKLNTKQKQDLNLLHISRYELDIYIPDLNAGVEFNGTYYHSFKGLKRGRPSWTNRQIKTYHKDKVKYFNSLNIKIIMVNEKDWTDNKEKVLQKIKEVLNDRSRKKTNRTA